MLSGLLTPCAWLLVTIASLFIICYVVAKVLKVSFYVTRVVLITVFCLAAWSVLAKLYAEAWVVLITLCAVAERVAIYCFPFVILGFHIKEGINLSITGVLTAIRRTVVLPYRILRLPWTIGPRYRTRWNMQVTPFSMRSYLDAMMPFAYMVMSAIAMCWAEPRLRRFLVELDFPISMAPRRSLTREMFKCTAFVATPFVFGTGLEIFDACVRR